MLKKRTREKAPAQQATIKSANEESTIAPVTVHAAQSDSVTKSNKPLQPGPKSPGSTSQAHPTSTSVIGNIVTMMLPKQRLFLLALISVSCFFSVVGGVVSDIQEAEKHQVIHYANVDAMIEQRTQSINNDPTRSQIYYERAWLYAINQSWDASLADIEMALKYCKDKALRAAIIQRKADIIECRRQRSSFVAR